ncbi:MAG TPA: GAP family protein [Solirubrobacterales bacterium]
MSPESILLASVNALRPTGLAAVYALLSTPRPRRLLVGYVAVGFAWSFAVGILVVVALGGVRVETGSSTANSVVSLGLGAAAVGFAAGIATGRIETPSPGRSTGQSRVSRALRDPSLAVAAGAGVAAHLPGLLYLLGLNSISETRPGFAVGAVNVLIFDAIWFAIPIAALAVALRRPAAARAALDRGSAWAHRHERRLAIVVFAVVGVAFALKGAVDLLS